MSSYLKLHQGGSELKLGRAFMRKPRKFRQHYFTNPGKSLVIAVDEVDLGTTTRKKKHRKADAPSKRPDQNHFENECHEQTLVCEKKKGPAKTQPEPKGD